LVYDSPAAHPRVDAEEKQFLLSFQLQTESKVRKVRMSVHNRSK
jgi:hypothetical protein